MWLKKGSDPLVYTCNKFILKPLFAYEWNSSLCVLSDTLSFIDSFLSYAADMVLPHKGNFMD